MTNRIYYVSDAGTANAKPSKCMCGHALAQLTPRLGVCAGCGRMWRQVGGHRDLIEMHIAIKELATGIETKEEKNNGPNGNE